MLRSILTAACLTVALASPALEASECFTLDPRTTMRRATLVFEGTVVSVEGLGNQEGALTMEVQRVWKGRMGRQVTVFYQQPSDGGWIPWKPGERRLIFTNVALEGRPTVARSRAQWVDLCYGMTQPDPEIIRRLGRSRKPQAGLKERG